MADRVSASIVLGGTIDTSAFAEFSKLIAQEGLSIEWDGEPFQPDDIAPNQPLALRTKSHAAASRRWRPGASPMPCRSPAGLAPMPANGVPSVSSSPAPASRHRSPPMRTIMS